MNDRPRPVVELQTRCACGGVTLAVSGPVRSMFMCACEDCQRATGTGHSAVAIFDTASVAVTGETRSFGSTAASGATFTRTFCPTCGNPIHGRSSRWADALVLPVGLFGRNSDWFSPTQLIFSRSHRAWDMISGAIPHHETYRPRTE